MSAPASSERQVLRRDGTRGPDVLVCEEPLEVRVAGETIATTMRTPGDDLALAVGFLFAEGIIDSIDDVGAVFHCGKPGDEGYGNIVDVTVAPGAHVVLQRMDRSRRGTLTTAACGVCGRATIDDLLARLVPVESTVCVSRSVIARAPDVLRSRQVLFTATGGSHAAALLDVQGNVLAAAEDIGRHNAVDKVVGALVQRRSLDAAVLAVSGRTSFEIVQKAARARVPVVCSVSAVSTMAADLAEKAGIAVAYFTRDGHFTIAGARHRIAT